MNPARQELSFCHIALRLTGSKNKPFHRLKHGNNLIHQVFLQAIFQVDAK
jgi:hypothetical protein